MGKFCEILSLKTKISPQCNRGGGYPITCGNIRNNGDLIYLGYLVYYRVSKIFTNNKKYLLLFYVTVEDYPKNKIETD